MKVLIASAWRNPRRSYDIAVWKKRRNFFSLQAPFTEHFGLRFLKANVPTVEVLEYPTREQFLSRLREPWDVVGISFYINETNDAVRMAEEARKRGARQVWAGNYGAFSDSVQPHFDRCVIGWGEAPVAESVGGDFRELRHPSTFMHIKYKGIPVQRWGVLFTSRGCNKTCNFCQTPSFYRRPHPLPLATIEGVLRRYRRARVDQIIVLDENFGHFDDFTREVTDLLDSYGMSWNPLTRVDTLHRNYEEWTARGLCGASLGVESLNQDSLDAARKGNSIEQTRELLSWMKRDNLFVQTFYIIGFEPDTEESIRSDIVQLKEFAIDAPQIQILTPFPNTMQYRAIEKRFGIRERDLSKYDSTHLVWNHPRIGPEQMRKLLFWCNDTLYDSSVTFGTLRKLFKQRIGGALRRTRGLGGALRRFRLDLGSGRPYSG